MQNNAIKLVAGRLSW